MMNDGDGKDVTMWSGSLLESLYFALRKQKSDAAIKQILAELRQKGFGTDNLIGRVESEVGAQAARRVQGLLLKGGGQRAGQRPGSRPARTRKRRGRAAVSRRGSGLEGILGWLQGLLQR